MPKSGNEDHRQELREELKEKLDYIASYSSLRTYSMSRGSRSDDYAERCTKIIKTAPNALSLNILTDFLKTKFRTKQCLKVNRDIDPNTS